MPSTRPVLYAGQSIVSVIVMPRSMLLHPPRGFAWITAAVATAFAGVGTLIVAGAGSTPVGQIMSVLVGFLLVCAGAALALSRTPANESARDRSDDWPW